MQVGGLLACVDACRAAVTRAAALSLVLVVVGGRLWSQVLELRAGFLVAGADGNRSGRFD